MTLRNRIGFVLALASVFASPALVQSASAAPIPEITISPGEDVVFPEPTDSTNCRLITFDSARVVANQLTGDRTLVVKGYAPYAGATVRLDPLVYFRQPEFWGIQVIGCMPEMGATAMTPYTASLELTGSTGTLGVEVIGVDRSQRIRICSSRSTWYCRLQQPTRALS